MAASPPPFDPESVADPFGTKSKTAASPTSEEPKASPFMSSKELSSPDVFKGECSDCLGTGRLNQSPLLINLSLSNGAVQTKRMFMV